MSTDDAVRALVAAARTIDPGMINQARDNCQLDLTEAIRQQLSEASGYVAQAGSRPAGKISPGLQRVQEFIDLAQEHLATASDLLAQALEGAQLAIANIEEEARILSTE